MSDTPDTILRDALRILSSMEREKEEWKWNVRHGDEHVLVRLLQDATNHGHEARYLMDRARAIGLAEWPK